LKKIAVGLSVLLGIYVLMLLKDAGVFRSVQNIAFGTCTPEPLQTSSEDVALVPNTDLAVISSDSFPVNEGEGLGGALVLYDLKKKNTFQSFMMHSFHPHGLDVLMKGKDVYVYVVNHVNHEKTTVEVFTLNPIKHLKTIYHPLFQSGNDIAVVDTDRFYITSDRGTTNRFRQQIESYIRQATGYISYYDGKDAKIVAEELFFANGLVFSPDKKKLYAAAMLEKAIHVYEVGSPDLKEVDVIEVDGGPDNLTWYEDSLIVAAHPNLFALKAEMGDREKNAPSKVIEIFPDRTTKTLYENTGDEISSASVGLKVSEDRILIGSVFDNKLLDCSR
jgi:arylesterase / paraoxonase